MRANQARVDPRARAWISTNSDQRDPRRPPRQLTFLLAARLLWDKGVAEFVEAARQLGRPAAPTSISRSSVSSKAPFRPRSPKRSSINGAGKGWWNSSGPAADVRAMFASCRLPGPSHLLPRRRAARAAGGVGDGGCRLSPARWPGCVEAVDDGVTGLLCPAPLRLRAWPPRCERMADMESQNEREIMGKAGRRKMELRVQRGHWFIARISMPWQRPASAAG